MLTGYVEFVLLLFLPGLATLAVLRQLETGNLISILARSYGISLSLNSLITFIISLTIKQVSFLPASILALSSVAVVALAIPNLARIRTGLRLVIYKETLVVLLFAVIFAVLVLSQFIKYPIFPKNYSVDFTEHVRITDDVIRTGAAGPEALLYYGVHYNLALGLLLTGGVTFIEIQFLMAILSVPSCILVYEVGKRIYKSVKLALIGQVLFIATGFAWYIPLYNSGLYPNLFSIILSLAYLVELQNILHRRGLRRFLTFTIIAFALYLSHYFAPVLTVAVLVSLLLAVGLRSISFRQVALPAVITIAPLASFVIRPDLIGFGLKILQVTSTTGVIYRTPLSIYFSFNPFLQYLVAQIFNYGGLLLIFGMPLSLYYILRNRQEALAASVMPIWVVLLWVIAPMGELAWRFSFQALAPLVLFVPPAVVLIASSLKWLFVEQKERRGRVKRSGGRKAGLTTFEKGAIGLLVLVMFAGSWSYIMTSDLASGASQYAQAQSDVYDSIIWFAHNTPSGSSLLSVTDWRIYFMETMTGRTGDLLMLASAPRAISYAKSHGFGYILLTYSIPANVPDSFDANTFISSFSSNQSLKAVYSSGNDVIYQVVK